MTHLFAPESVIHLLAPKSCGFTWLCDSSTPQSFERERNHSCVCPRIRDSSTCAWIYVTQMSPWLRWVRDSSTCPRSLWEREREIYTLPESDTHLIAPESVTHLLAPESFEKETYYWSILAPDSVTHLIAPESVTRLLAPKSSGITWHGPRLRWVRDSSTCPRNLLMQHPPLHWEETTPPAQHNSNMCIHICITC